MNIVNFFPKENIFFLSNNDKQSVFKEMLEKLEELGKIDNSEKYLHQVIHRESLENTGLGNGFAIPHVRNDSIDNLISIFAVCPDCIDYHSYDDIPVKYLLLCIIPSEQSIKYLYLVGMMANFFLKDNNIKILEEANTTNKIFNILNQNAKLYYDTITQKNEINEKTTGNISGINPINLDLLIKLDRLYQLLDEGVKPKNIINKINELKKLVDNRLLAYYERMKKKHSSPFSIIENKSCSKCNMDLPSSDLSKNNKINEVQKCNYCGRILIKI